MRKNLFANVRRKYAVIYRDIAARFAAADTEPKRRSGSGSVSCGGAAHGLVALSKNHSRILPLTFLHFAHNQPRGLCVCARVHARASTTKRANLDYCPLQPPMAPTDFVCRHARVRRALKDRFFGVTGSHSIPL